MLYTKLLGAPGVNRTPDYGLQNRRFTTRTNGAKLAGKPGLEPGTDRLTADCSTN